jgi:hypothetical protein
MDGFSGNDFAGVPQITLILGQQGFAVGNQYLIGRLMLSSDTSIGGCHFP